MAISSVSIIRGPIELAAHEQNGATGAAVDFLGIVRGEEGDRLITAIEYEANVAMAEHQLSAIAEKAAGDFDISRIILTHRIGLVKVGEASLFLHVESAHRAAAFSASVWIVDELKKRVPIWKRPVFAEPPKKERELEKTGARAAESSLRA